MSLTKEEKKLAFQAEMLTEEIDDDMKESGHELAESFASLIKNFVRFLKKAKRSSFNPKYNMNNNFQKGKAGLVKSNSIVKRKGIYSREYEGFSHIQAKCANSLKKNIQTTKLPLMSVRR